MGLPVNFTPYEPREDTFLLAEAVEQSTGDRGLEIGVGRGVVLTLVSGRVRFAVGTDLDFAALRATYARIRANGLQADLVRCDGAAAFRPQSFDLVAVNPPYLVSDGLGDCAVEGGMTGAEEPTHLLLDAARVLNTSGTVFFVLSTVSTFDPVLAALTAAGLQIALLKRLPLFYEELMVFRAERRG